MPEFTGLAVYCFVISCGHCCADNVPGAVQLTGDLQQLGAQLHVRIHPGALLLAEGPRVIPQPITRHDSKEVWTEGMGSAIFCVERYVLLLMR